MAVNPVSIENIKPTHVDGAHVYITDANHKETMFVGAIEDTTLIDLRGIALNLKSKYIVQVFFACRIHFNLVQAEALKKEISLFRNYEDKQELNDGCLHALDILEAAANIILEHKGDYIYIIGD